MNVEWDGRDDEGRIVPDGSYRPRLTLESGARSFVLRNPIQLDTRAPKMTVTRVSPKVFSPDGDGRNDQVIVRYRVDEPAHGILRVDGVRRVYTLLQAARGCDDVERQAEGRPPSPCRRPPARRGGGRRGGKRGQGAATHLRDHSLHRARSHHHPGAGSDPVRGPRDRPTRRPSAGGSRAERASAGRGCSSCERPAQGRYLLFVEANGHGARARVVVRPRQSASSRSPTASR